MKTSERIPDRIEKMITLRAPIARVWRAISDAQAFGAWFGVAFDGPFIAGKRVTGKIQPTTVDPDVAALQAPHAGKAFAINVESMDAPRLFSFRWHPYDVDPAADLSEEPTTLVAFELAEVTEVAEVAEVAEGTLLTISESGFDRIPLARRAESFTANEGGWEHQSRLIEKYLASHAS